MLRVIAQAIICMATIALASAAHARDLFLQLPTGAPASQAAQVSDVAIDPHIYGGVGIDGTNFTVSVPPRRFGLAVGLFGPLGGLATMRAAENEARQNGSTLAALVHTDVKSLLRGNLPLPSGAIETGLVRYDLEPVVILTFTDEVRFRLNCIVRAHLPVGSPRGWSGMFRAFPSDVYDMSDSASLSLASTKLPDCVNDAYLAFVEFVDHHAEVGPPEKLNAFSLPPNQSRFVSVRSRDGQRLFVGDAYGMISYPANSVTFDDVGH